MVACPMVEALWRPCVDCGTPTPAAAKQMVACPMVAALWRPCVVCGTPTPAAAKNNGCMSHGRSALASMCGLWRTHASCPTTAPTGPPRCTTFRARLTSTTRLMPASLCTGTLARVYGT
eukprot:919489-Pelagomonas_calceolata.AAC.2